MIVVLTGPNDYIRNKNIASLKAKFFSANDEFSLEVIDATESEIGRIIDSVASVPFLTDRRMVILTNLASAKNLSESADKIIDSVADTTDLIIDERKFDKRSSLYKIIKKRVELREFNELDDRQLATWLVAESKNRQASLSLADARYLTDRAGPNQLMLDSELDKLINYNPKISRQSIELLVYPTPSGSMFDLLDVAFAGNHARALELYADQRSQQVEPQAIMGMIAWQLHIIAVVKFNSGTDIASRAKLNPYVVKKTAKLASRLSEADVRQLIDRTVRLDHRLKTSAVDADDAVQHFLLTI